MKKWAFFLFLMLSIPCFAGECDFTQLNTCRSCDDPKAFLVGSVDACSFLCPGRVVNFEGSGSGAAQMNCALSKCPPDSPFQSRYGSCYKTQEEAENDLGYGEEESVFDQSPLPETPTMDPIDGKCLPNWHLIDRRVCLPSLKGSSMVRPQNGECPEGYEMGSGLVFCKPCIDANDWDVTKDECNQCSNRVYKEYKEWGVTQCERVCPKETPFKRWDGKCFPCDYPKAIRVETHCNIEGDCDDICPNRTIIKSIGGNVPSVLNCPADKPMMDDEGICYSCDTPVDIGVQWNPDFCQRFCPNERHLLGDFCVLNTADYDPSKTIITDPLLIHPTKERFVNPLFYEPMTSYPDRWITRLSPTGYTESKPGISHYFSCFMVENTEDSIILNCNRDPIDTKDGGQNIRVFHKYVLEPQDAPTYRTIKHFHYQKQEGEDRAPEHLEIKLSNPNR